MEDTCLELAEELDKIAQKFNCRVSYRRDNNIGAIVLKIEIKHENQNVLDKWFELMVGK